MALGGAPTEIVWDHQVSAFLDMLAENDVRYIDLQEAIEQLVHSGLKHNIAVPLAIVNGETVYWHPVPKLFPMMRAIHVFWVEDDSRITVIHAEFA